MAFADTINLHLARMNSDKDILSVTHVRHKHTSDLLSLTGTANMADIETTIILLISCRLVYVFSKNLILIFSFVTH